MICAWRTCLSWVTPASVPLPLAWPLRLPPPSPDSVRSHPSVGWPLPAGPSAIASAWKSGFGAFQGLVAAVALAADSCRYR
uniref:Putative secreted protein n=1 Tax=Anopheles triannulatus TaxID=58253 RepID=A0A2M4B5U8_9DIPT